LKRSSLSSLNFGHLVRKWVSSSISWFVQFLHILSFLGILVYLPVSMKSLWVDVCNLQMDFLYSLFRGDVISSNNNESAIFRRWKSNLKWRMFYHLNDKGDNSLTEIPGCPEKRIHVLDPKDYESHDCMTWKWKEAL
jgi:hypothetical protein